MNAIRPQGQWQWSRLLQSPGSKKGVLALVVLAAGVGWYLATRGLPCDEGLVRFRRALERTDFDELYAITSDLDKTRLGLTKEAVERAFRETVFQGGRQVRTRIARIDTPAQQADRWAWRTIALSDAQTGKNLPTLHESGEYVCVVRLYQPSNRGWQIVMSETVRSIYLLNHTARVPGGPASPAGVRRRRTVEQKLVSWGIRGTFGSPEYVIQPGGKWTVSGEPVLRRFDVSRPR